MTRKMTLQRVFRAVASCAFASALFVACKGEEIPTLPPGDEPSNEDAGNNQPNNQGDSGIDLACLRPAATCPCSMEGAIYDCRAYYYVNKGTPEQYQACSIGYFHCVDGEWSECIGERIVRVAPDEIPPNTVFEDGPLPGLGDGGL
ncbi:MAG TPA: hypothetical protein VHO25_00385 [Polyangiaceae bacterium]|nr:hypothetical protein [Polyangiaceae bacterium]